MTGFLTLLALLPTVEPTAGSAAWASFRNGGQSVTTAKGLPLTWTATENVAWQIDLPGHGQSSPVVWKDTVFVTAVAGAMRDKGYVLAYDAGTGKKRWSHEFEPTQKAKWSEMISRAAPTPVVDADAVYAFFEGGNLLALSHEGKPIWTRALFKEFGEFENNHGLGSSPAQTEDTLFVLVDHRGPSYLLAVDKKTGKDRWKTTRTSRGSWTSPTIARRGGQVEVIVSSNGTVAGYEATTGKLLWELDGLSGNTIPSASVAEDRIVIGAGQGRMGADPEAAAKSNCCLKLVEKAGKPSYEVAWIGEKVSASYATPLVHGGYVYFVNQAGLVSCLDLKDGTQKYAERLESACWASPIGAGDRVYFFGRDGSTTVLKAGPVFEKLAANVLIQRKAAPQPMGEYGGVTVYGVAAVDGAFFVRTGTNLIRIGKPAG